MRARRIRIAECYQNFSKEADTHFISFPFCFPLPPPSHRSATPMTARLVLRAASRRMAVAGLFLEEGMSNAPNCLGRPPPSAAICRSRSCRWLGADARYALPLSDQVLTTFCCATHGSPGPASSHPHTPIHSTQREGNDVVSTMTPLSLEAQY